MTEQSQPLFDSKLNFDAGIRELWESGEQLTDDETIKSVNYEGQYFIAYAYRGSDMYLENPEHAEETVDSADRHFEKFVELGGHVVSYALEPVSTRNPFLKRLKRPESDPVLAYGVTTAPEDTDPSGNIPELASRHKIIEEVIEPAMQLIDWWLSQSEDPYISTYLAAQFSYNYHRPSRTIFLNDVTPTVENLAALFSRSPETGHDAIKIYRDAIQSMFL